MVVKGRKEGRKGENKKGERKEGSPGVSVGSLSFWTQRLNAIITELSDRQLNCQPPYTGYIVVTPTVHLDNNVVWVNKLIQSLKINLKKVKLIQTQNKL